MPLILSERFDSVNGFHGTSYPPVVTKMKSSHTATASTPKPPPLDLSSSNGSAILPGPTHASPTQSASSSPVSASFLRKSSDLVASSYPPLSQSTLKANNTNLHVPNSVHRLSSPARFENKTGQTSGSPMLVEKPVVPRLQHRHTLEVPRSSAGLRTSKDLGQPGSANSEDLLNGKLSPATPVTPGRQRRSSLQLGRRATRSVHSDPHMDDLPPDEEAARWAEAIRQKRASKRRKKEEEDDDRVIVGTKVDQNHVNWVTAYNMLTGIRFTVSRTNAKLDRELTPADFTAANKFSFDITGNELTPSAKYDFKFKDYSPWVFRHLRTIFKIDPADYLMSLTSKYILSELGSPGKSGSFFYFSRDYKYIIKTIHHAEHVFLRKILKDYYNHVRDNPNTLLSQFYGLHRVEIPYGRKIHFVVMNNLFPPHRDIHRTFDLKGSTVGRDFKEEDLEQHPRATLKDLNWLRRNMHLEFGPTKKSTFVEQMERDVALLKRLKIMDYSLLVGIHDMNKGNDENLRDKTLRVFQPNPSPETSGVDLPSTAAHLAAELVRSPSKLENARKAKELRQSLKNQRPVPMTHSLQPMPAAAADSRQSFYFYADDGGFRATHGDDTPGEAIYYLGIIDCLTRYNIVKRAEHLVKGLASDEAGISAIPPRRYGDRFVKFISSITAPREQVGSGNLDGPIGEKTHENHMYLGDNEKRRSQSRGSASEGERASGERIRTTIESDRDGTTLPVVEEAVETASVGEKSKRSASGEKTGVEGERRRAEERLNGQARAGM